MRESRIISWWGSLLLALVVITGGLVAGEKVEGQGNIVAARLTGIWESEPESATPARAQVVFSYRPEDSVLKELVSSYRSFLMRKRVFSAGILTSDGSAQPAIIIEHNGNPYLMTFPANGITGQHILLVPGSKASDDRLYLGGEQATEVFRGYRRRTNQG